MSDQDIKMGFCSDEEQLHDLVRRMKSSIAVLPLIEDDYKFLSALIDFTFKSQDEIERILPPAKPKPILTPKWKVNCSDCGTYMFERESATKPINHLCGRCLADDTYGVL